MSPPTPVILVCPCCASPLDAVASEHEQEFTCLACGQHWRMTVDLDRFARHSLT